MGFTNPDSKVRGAKMGPIWGRQAPGGPHVGPVNLAIWEGWDLLFLGNHHDVFNMFSFIINQGNSEEKWNNPSDTEKLGQFLQNIQ